MSPELSKRLKEAGFPFLVGCPWCGYPPCIEIEGKLFSTPTSDELIEEMGIWLQVCGKDDVWNAFDFNREFVGEGSNPVEALAELYIAIHKNTTS